MGHASRRPNFENVFGLGGIATDRSGSAIVTGDFSSQSVTFGEGERRS